MPRNNPSAELEKLDGSDQYHVTGSVTITWQVTARCHSRDRYPCKWQSQRIQRCRNMCSKQISSQSTRYCLLEGLHELDLCAACGATAECHGVCTHQIVATSTLCQTLVALPNMCDAVSELCMARAVNLSHMSQRHCRRRCYWQCSRGRYHWQCSRGFR